ncbi:DUF1656 domain-containing protein [Herbaspirillum lusitanum]|jgi:hypothetical protein|uniref:DUF1656 domain-containing protein n=1 Tax=Herbaspirillum lusitanum TaxID=213312 RepID=A0ABW9AAS2_9BURK
MPREISFFDAYVPTLLLAVLIAGAITLLLDRVLVRFGVYSLVWHPALVRVSLFTCIAAWLGLAIYA